MNERILELAEQAGMVKILDEHANEYGAGMLENYPYPELERFAELIVRECAEIAKRNGCKPDPYSENYDAQVAAERKAQEIYDEIMCNFGVEL